MIKIKSLILAFSLSPLLLSAWQLPSQAQLSQNSPSKGTAGSVSGNNAGAGSISVFSVPVNVQTGGGTFTITVSPTVQAALNAAAQSAVVALQSGGSTQQQIASLLASGATLTVSSTEAPVAGGISLQTVAGAGQSSPTLAAAIVSVGNSISALPNGSVSLQIGGNTIVISNP
ncbi:hypothetical protein GNF10_07325 [Nostoc sp. UCD121]|uniref:hypothetical protein n=1 Tax=unclassified Nostoc TaxID=2593658 RepID=UPI001629A662|nr:MULTISPECIES: hypothetical protein [unclassified Nostoc]MBC1224308.1 hypothetical protein [Nostoc sp. UCD120]MBC1275802.1 hypothetical protein [Nostoc sp. UCD121]MBC1295554.1 hypothetical protein [Nostoc sp. UCD122]